MLEPRPGAVAVRARFAPCAAAAAAMPAQDANRQFDGNDESVPRLTARHQNLAAQNCIAFVAWTSAEKGVAHAFDGQLHAREVDGDFVCEAIL